MLRAEGFPDRPRLEQPLPIQIDLDQERQSQALPGPGTFVEEVGDAGKELRISPLHSDVRFSRAGQADIGSVADHVRQVPGARSSGSFTRAGGGVIFNRRLPMGRAEIL